MTNEPCDCGIPIKRPDNEKCLRCKKTIDNKRIQGAQVINYEDTFKDKKCECNENVKANWGSRKIGDILICNFCDSLTNSEPIGLDSLDLFSDLDIPYELDPSKYQYKVVTQKDRFFSSKFNPALIERALNEYAQEGWRLKEAVTADFGSIGMSRNELILFLEKKPDGEIDS